MLVLALDAASPVLLERWAADRTLPNLAELMGTGLVGDTRSVEGLYIGATWPSFWTGQNPAGHGIYWFDRLIPGTYRLQRAGSADFSRSEALWEAIGKTGRRALLMDVPFLRPSRSFKGVHVAEWGAHDVNLGFTARPSRVKRSILRREGRHPAPPACDSIGRSLDDYRTLAEQLCRGAAARAALTRRLLAEEAWDFAIQVFAETHCAGHQLWHFHDPAHPAYDPKLGAETGDLVRQVYVAVDRALGEIVSCCDASTTVVVLDLHGMSYYCGSTFLLPDILIRMGVLARPASSDVAALPETEPGLSGRLKRAYHRLPERLRAPVYHARQYANQHWLRRGTPLALDPLRSQCFDFGLGSTFAALRLNLKGREPQGTVASGEEAERLRETLTRDLLALRYADTGEPAVRRVLPMTEFCRGRRLEELPDLLIEWDADRPLGSAIVGGGPGALLRLSAPGLGTVEGANSYGRTGDHRIEGLFIARGPGIRPGRLGRVVSILDLAPSLAARFGASLPEADGHAIPELVS